MDPERGDPSVIVRREHVAAAARECGVAPGDTLMFHSSLSSIGTVEGGPDTVIDGFLDVLGPGGTLAVPTLCRAKKGEEALIFDQWDPTTSPSYVGAITEHFRRRPDAVRSDNATHSVAAIGARAVELTADHGARGARLCCFGVGAFAASSPWQRFFDWNAAYGFIGVNFTVNTMVHFVECRLVERALAKAPESRRAELAGQVRGWAPRGLRHGVWPSLRIQDRLVYEETLVAEGLERHSRIGSATFRCLRARPMVERWLAFVESDPERWLPEDYLRWLGRAHAGA